MKVLLTVLILLSETIGFSQKDCPSSYTHMPSGYTRIPIRSETILAIKPNSQFLLLFAKPADSLKTYYYMWTANHGTRSSWGEYSLQLNHMPTKSEVRGIVLKMLGNDLFYKKYLRIEIIADSKPAGLDPGRLAYDIFRYRR